MENNKKFIIEFEHDTIELPKSSVNFENGYAVVEETITKSVKAGQGFWRALDINLKGVIDEDFDTVIDFRSYYCYVKLFPEGNVIVKIICGNLAGYKHLHYKINGKKADMVAELSAWEYDRVNETTIKLKNDAFNSGFEALYDVVKGQLISEKFTTIENFEQYDDNKKERFAKAILRIPYDPYNNSSDNVCDIVCFIDEEGNIRKPLYNPHTNSYINTTTADFSFTKTIETIREKINEDMAKKETEINKLKKLIY